MSEGAPEEATYTGFENRLRGSLIKSGEEIPGEEKITEEPRLRGSLMKNSRAPEEPPRLRGKLLDRMKHEGEEEAVALSRLRGSLLEGEGELEPYTKEWLSTKTFINRDGKDEYMVRDFNETRGRNMLVLYCPATKSTLAKGLTDFVEALKQPGSPWSIKE